MVSGRALSACCVALLFSAATLVAAGSEVADAAMKADKAALRTLLQQRNVDVNAPQADGATALHWAIWKDDVEMTTMLIRAGANVNAANLLGATPLFLAAGAGSTQILGELLKAGVNPNAALSPSGDTALMLAARTGKPDAVKVLLDGGADVNVREGWGGTTALMWAASEKHTAVVEMLIARGADLNVRSKIVRVPERRGDGNMLGFAPMDPLPGQTPESMVDGNELNVMTPSGGLTALLMAVREGDRESARLLLDGGANINATAADLSTPLTLAIQNGFYDIAMYLIDRGANIHQADVLGGTPLWLAVHARNHDYSVGIPWIQTADPMPLIQRLLDMGADPNHRVKHAPPYRKNNASSGSPWLVYSGATAFLRASAAGDIVTMRLLLKYGADPGVRTLNGVTPLLAATGIGYMGGHSKEWSRAQRYETIKFLLDLGGSLEAVDEVGRTPLHAAAAMGYNEVIQLLVDAGARLDAKDKGGSTDSDEPLIPLDYALGVRLFTASSPVSHPESEELIRKLMAEKGIEHTTSECTLRGFTCGDKSPRDFGQQATPATTR